MWGVWRVIRVISSNDGSGEEYRGRDTVGGAVCVCVWGGLGARLLVFYETERRATSISAIALNTCAHTSGAFSITEGPA